VRQPGMLRLVSESARRLGWVGAGAAVVVAAVPLTAAAVPRRAAPRAHSAATVGAVYGGFTSQNYPVVVEFNKSRRRVVRAGVGLHLSCATGGGFSLPDRYADVKVSKKGRFSSSFSDTERNDDGTTTDLEGSFNGALNKARTKVTGKWTEKTTQRDASGAVTDTCDSGSISWTAKQ
jgi:hypothetical protein